MPQALKSQVPQQAKKRFGVYQKPCFQGKKKENTYTPKRLQGVCGGPLFKGKRRKIRIHQSAFKVSVGDPFAQYWCIDFGLVLLRRHVCRTKLPRKTLNRYEKRFEKREERSEKTIRNVFEKILAPLRPLKNISPALFNKL